MVSPPSRPRINCGLVWKTCQGMLKFPVEHDLSCFLYQTPNSIRRLLPWKRGAGDGAVSLIYPSAFNPQCAYCILHLASFTLHPAILIHTYPSHPRLSVKSVSHPNSSLLTANYILITTY
jgi:hypothetical protein